MSYLNTLLALLKLPRRLIEPVKRPSRDKYREMVREHRQLKREMRSLRRYIEQREEGEGR